MAVKSCRVILQLLLLTIFGSHLSLLMMSHCNRPVIYCLIIFELEHELLTQMSEFQVSCLSAITSLAAECNVTVLYNANYMFKYVAHKTVFIPGFCFLLCIFDFTDAKSN